MDCDSQQVLWFKSGDQVTLIEKMLEKAEHARWVANGLP